MPASRMELLPASAVMRTVAVPLLAPGRAAAALVPGDDLAEGLGNLLRITLLKR